MRRRDALPDPEVVHGLRELDAALAGETTADPELTRLVADVEAARPEPSAAFLASLDARVHAGFARDEAVREPRASWLARLRRPQVLAPGFAVLVVAAVVAIGLGAGQRSSPLSGDLGSSSDDSGAVMEAAPQVESSSSSSSSSAGAADSDTSAAKALTAPAAPSPDAPTARRRSVERAAELTLTPAPKDVQETADGVIRETQAAGGYVQRSEISTHDDGGSASFTLRVPSARLDDTLARLSKLAHVGALNQSAEDITAQTVSAAEQLSDARDERRALLRALGRATTDRQIASLKARLRDNRSEIAARKGALDAQRRRADMATVSVTVEGSGRPDDNADDGAWTPRDALHDAGRVLEVAGGVTLIALAVLTPLALLAALAWLAARTTRRRGRETALDRSA